MGVFYDFIDSMTVTIFSLFAVFAFRHPVRTWAFPKPTPNLEHLECVLHPVPRDRLAKKRYRWQVKGSCMKAKPP